MSDIEVRELKIEEYKIWDELVETSPNGTIFHSSDWLTICSKSLNKKLKIYGCFENNKIVAGCSLYNYKLKKIFNAASSTIEMTPYGGIVLSKHPSTKVRTQELTYGAIVKSLCSVLNNKHFDYINITNSPDLIDVRSFIWNEWDCNIHYAYYFKLDTEIEKKVSKNIRQTVATAIKNNITIKKLNDPALFYRLLSMTFERQNLKVPATKSFFEKILDMLSEKQLGEMWIAETDTGEVAAAEIIIWDDKRAYRWAVAAHTEFKNVGATSLLLYQLFHDLKNKRFKEINLMAANTPQLAFFISSFNPQLIPYN